MQAAIETKSQAYAQKALQTFTRVIEQDKVLAPAVHFGMGKVYLLALKQPEKALSHLEQAVKATPDVAEVYGLLIQAYYDTQRYQEAWQRLRMAQSLGFEFPKLRDALYKIKQREQR
jgi:tetratricopeptide (TPR) repeat protein